MPRTSMFDEINNDVFVDFGNRCIGIYLLTGFLYTEVQL